MKKEKRVYIVTSKNIRKTRRNKKNAVRIYKQLCSEGKNAKLIMSFHDNEEILKK